MTYLIVERLLKQAEERRWSSIRKWLSGNLQGKNEIAILVWAMQADPTLVRLDLPLSKEHVSRMGEALRIETTELGKHVPLPASVRPDNYWLGVARGLGSSDELAANALDRAAVVLQDDPELLNLLLKLDEAHRTVAAFRADESTFGAGVVAVVLPTVVLNALQLHLKLADILSQREAAR